jgi:hypothetical protein
MKSSFLPLHLVCLAGFIGAFINMLLMFSPLIWQIAPWYPAYVCFSTTVTVAALGGLWALRRWAVWLYLGGVLVNQSVYLALHLWKSVILVLPFLIFCVILFYYRKMK